MKEIFEHVILSARRNLPDVVAIFVAILFFHIVSGNFIIEKSIFAKLYGTAVGFAGGLIGGGALGWAIGGIGVAAMGTAAGVSALEVIVIGGVIGAVLGGLTGTSFTFIKVIRNPDEYDISFGALFGVLITSIIIFFAVRRGIHRLITLRKRMGASKVIQE